MKKNSLKELSNKELIKRTQEIEDEKNESKRLRLEKAKEKERKKQQQQIEKLVAPILLIITVLISLIVKISSKN